MVDELLGINYTEKIIDCVRETFNSLAYNEKVVLSARYGIYNELFNNVIFESDNDIQINDKIQITSHILQEFYESLFPKNRFSENRKYTLEEIGQELGLTRERIRQIEKRALKRFSKEFQKQFQKYYEVLSQQLQNKQTYLYLQETDKLIKYESLINTIWDLYENITFYIDFSVGLIIKKGLSLEKILEDENLPADIKQKIEKFIYRSYVTIDNKRIKDNKVEILNYYLKVYCRKPKKFSDIQNLYMDMLIANGLQDRTDLLYDDSTLYNKLTHLNYILLSPGKVLRYYEPENIEKVINNINLDKYHDVEISARKIFLDNFELMEKYEIYDEYELHNLLKKNINNPDIKFVRMPTIRFGNANKDAQVLDLLKRLSPISNIDLAKAYEDEYGVDITTFFSGYLKSISQYLNDGVYSLDIEVMSEEDLRILQKELVNEFYWKEDLESLYKNTIRNANLKNLNSYNLNKLNYTMTSTCIYSNKYSSLSDYIKHFLAQDIINMKLNNKFRSVQLFYVYYSEYKNNLELIEFSPDICINVHKLESVGIDKNILIDYQKRVKDFCTDEFFTIYSLRNKGFKYDMLDNLGFDDYFYSSILINDSEIQFKKISDVYLMKKNSNSFDFADFLIYIIGKFRKIDIYDLCDYIKAQYNLDINRYKIITITKECSLYYSQITEKVYIDYDEFYNEI